VRECPRGEVTAAPEGTLARPPPHTHAPAKAEAAAGSAPAARPLPARRRRAAASQPPCGPGAAQPGSGGSAGGAPLRTVRGGRPTRDPGQARRGPRAAGARRAAGPVGRGATRGPRPSATLPPHSGAASCAAQAGRQDLRGAGPERQPSLAAGPRGASRASVHWGHTPAQRGRRLPHPRHPPPPPPVHPAQLADAQHCWLKAGVARGRGRRVAKARFVRRGRRQPKSSERP